MSSSFTHLLQALRSVNKSIKLTKGECLFKQGSLVNFLYIVKEGVIKNEKTVNEADKKEIYYQGLDESKLNIIFSKLAKNRVNISDQKTFEIIGEMASGFSNTKHKFSAYCKSSSAVVYAIKLAKVMTFPEFIHENLKEINRTKSLWRIRRFQKNLLLKIKFLQTMNEKSFFNLKQLKQPLNNAKPSKDMRRIISLERITTQPQNTFRKGKDKENRKINIRPFLFELGDKLCSKNKDRKPLTQRNKRSDIFISLKKFSKSSRMKLTSITNKLQNTFKIAKKDLSVVKNKERKIKIKLKVIKKNK